MALRAIVFDLFDTLVDLQMENLPSVEVRGRTHPATAPDLHRAVSAQLEIGFDSFVDVLASVDREHWKSRYREGLEFPTTERFAVLIDRLGLSSTALVEQLTQIHMGRLVEQVAVVHHHAEVMEQLSRRVLLGVCSNFSHAETADAVLRDASIHQYFDAIVISETVGIRKPRPEIFEAVLAELDASPDEVVHVGDNLSADVEGAASLGIRTAWITRRVRDEKSALARYQGPRPTWHLSDLAELVELADRERTT
jgi:putative hydrolase of the HAD superfamily